jgi:hypothetical protein
MKLNFKWVKKTGQFTRGDYLYIGKIQLGGYDWNSSRTQGDSANPWVGNIGLPCLKNDRVYADSVEEVKQKVEQKVAYWFNHIEENSK